MNGSRARKNIDAQRGAAKDECPSGEGHNDRPKRRQRVLFHGFVEAGLHRKNGASDASCKTVQADFKPGPRNDSCVDRQGNPKHEHQDCNKPQYSWASLLKVEEAYTITDEAGKQLPTCCTELEDGKAYTLREDDGNENVERSEHATTPRIPRGRPQGGLTTAGLMHQGNNGNGQQAYREGCTSSHDRRRDGMKSQIRVDAVLRHQQAPSRNTRSTCLEA
eukprot:CAMPEP_0117523490 /NCGR_PEP_ID=MMETSP0784-20121206/34754_1 /TAXON_ID=39447 /ORGANISM="" /LENGTH=219 /DNA_ID=CAMNT_0005319603 /DNA_START=758 /DNA_END=1417 /DNA_ORIENTATION=+